MKMIDAIHNWIVNLFHVHQWKVIRNFDIDEYDEWSKSDRPIGRKIVYIMRCETCGKIKKKIIEV
jgi:hypothetical protein